MATTSAHLYYPLGRTRQDQGGLKTAPCQVFRIPRIVGGFGAHCYDGSAVGPQPQLKLVEERLEVLASQLRPSERADGELDITSIPQWPEPLRRLERLDQIAEWLVGRRRQARQP